jgi:hypothetical protein
MRHCSWRDANADRPRKGGPKCENVWLWSIPSHMVIAGNDEMHALGGLRENLFDLRRCAVVYYPHIFARSLQLQATP